MPLHPIVQKFSDYLDQPENAEFKQAFMDSLETARSTAVEEFKDIKDLEGYITYLDWYVNWVPEENLEGKNIYQKLSMFYYVLDLPPVNKYQDPIEPGTKPPYKWLTEWLIEYAQEMGRWMDTPASLTSRTLQTFYDSPSYHMQDYLVPPGGWKTFNEFFARKIKPDLRPIASPTDDTVVVSPADCTFDKWWTIDEDATVTFEGEEEEVKVKGIPWSIAQLLADDTPGSNIKYRDQFAGGVFTHSFLNTTDYHRQHAPVAGKVVCAKVIPGIVWVEVIYVPDGSGGGHLSMRRTLPKANLKARDNLKDFKAPDSPGYQFIQARALILIDNPVLGLVAVLPIGMSQVSSVVLSVKEGDVVTKGQEISYFQLGGSDVVMVFERDAHIYFEQDHGIHYNFGQRVAVGSPNQTSEL